MSRTTTRNCTCYPLINSRDPESAAASTVATTTTNASDPTADVPSTVNPTPATNAASNTSNASNNNHITTVVAASSSTIIRKNKTEDKVEAKCSGKIQQSLTVL